MIGAMFPDSCGKIQELFHTGTVRKTADTSGFSEKGRARGSGGKVRRREGRAAVCGVFFTEETATRKRPKAL